MILLVHPLQNNENDEILYPKELLNSLKFQGIPSHELEPNVGVMLLRDVNQTTRFCNGTRLIVTQLVTIIEAGDHNGKKRRDK